MHKDKPRRTAEKIAVNIISQGSKPAMEKGLPLEDAKKGTKAESRSPFLGSSKEGRW